MHLNNGCYCPDVLTALNNHSSMSTSLSTSVVFKIMVWEYSLTHILQSYSLVMGTSKISLQIFLSIVQSKPICFYQRRKYSKSSHKRQNYFLQQLGPVVYTCKCYSGVHSAFLVRLLSALDSCTFSKVMSTYSNRMMYGGLSQN